jgi:hypothetical protein
MNRVQQVPECVEAHGMLRRPADRVTRPAYPVSQMEMLTEITSSCRSQGSISLEAI